MPNTLYTFLAPENPIPYGESGQSLLTEEIQAIGLPAERELSGIAMSPTFSSWDLQFIDALGGADLTSVQAVVDAHTGADLVEYSASASPPITIPGAFRESGATPIGSSGTAIPLDVVDLNPDSAYTLSAGVVAVKLAGHYSISYSIPVDDLGAGGATRTPVIASVERDQGGGFAVIPNSWGQDYAREASGGEGVSAAFLCEIGADDIIRLVAKKSASTDIGTEAGKAQLSIHRIRGP